MTTCQRCGQPTGPAFGLCADCIRKADLVPHVDVHGVTWWLRPGDVLDPVVQAKLHPVRDLRYVEHYTPFRIGGSR
jgi:hypothetical protein